MASRLLSVVGCAESDAVLTVVEKVQAAEAVIRRHVTVAAVARRQIGPADVVRPVVKDAASSVARQLYHFALDVRRRR